MSGVIEGVERGCLRDAISGTRVERDAGREIVSFQPNLDQLGKVATETSAGYVRI